MKYLKSLTVVILFISFWGCSHDKFVTKFENTLGKENSQTLTELVSVFESDFLKRQYPNLNTKSAYGKFLTDLRDEKTDWKKISEESRAKFDNSSLKNEIYRYPDSVWIERDTAKMRIKSPMPVVKRRFKSLNKDGSVEYAISEGSYPGMNPLDIDKFLEQQKNSAEFNTVGKYIQALYQIKTRDSFFQKLYERKSSAGLIKPELTARFMLSENADLDDYLIKRIIALEIVY